VCRASRATRHANAALGECVHHRFTLDVGE
jgi:hypothetical protein